MNQAPNLDLSPHPSALLESLRSIGYTLNTALADIIDNSITAEATSISVRFLWDRGDPWIAVLDDGHGMARDELLEAMRFGSRNPSDERDANDLGRFGLGMKTASISQCRHLTVVSKRHGMTTACEWNLDAIASSTTDKWLAGIIDLEGTHGNSVLSRLIGEFLDKRDSGTIVLWQSLDNSIAEREHSNAEQRFSEAMDSARSHLETIFHRFLTPDPGKSALKIDFNGNSLEAFNPFGPSHGARRELPTEIVHVEGKKIVVQPYVLPHRSKVSTSEYEKYAGEQGYLNNQGFYIYRNRRLIVKATWFRIIKKEELNKLIRIRVDIPNSLDHLWKIDVKKSQASPPEAVRNELKKIIGRISGAGKLVFRRRAATIQNRQLNPVWRREVVEGKIRYGINEDHPLIRSVIERSNNDTATALRTCLRLISEAFPYETVYVDAAGDDAQIENPEHSEQEIRAVACQLIEALRVCGYEGEDLRREILKTEAYDFPNGLIDELLN